MDGMCYDPRLITFEFLSRLVLRKKQVPCLWVGGGWRWNKFPGKWCNTLEPRSDLWLGHPFFKEEILVTFSRDENEFYQRKTKVDELWPRLELVAAHSTPIHDHQKSISPSSPFEGDFGQSYAKCHWGRYFRCCERHGKVKVVWWRPHKEALNSDVYRCGW